MREWLEDLAPDIAVMIYNDHGLNFFLDKQPTFAIGAAPEYFLGVSIHDLVRNAGAQGAEFINWLTMRGARNGNVKTIHTNYTIPISNTAAGLMCLENAA